MGHFQNVRLQKMTKLKIIQLNNYVPVIEEFSTYNSSCYVMGNDTNLYGKYFAMWAIVKMAAFWKITKTINTPYYAVIEAFLHITPLCRFRGIMQIRIEVISLIYLGWTIWYGPFSKWLSWKNSKNNEHAILDKIQQNKYRLTNNNVYIFVTK